MKQNTQAILNEMEEDEHIDEEVIEKQRKALENYDEILEQLETSIDVLEAENEQKPFCIFGIPADMSLVMAGLSAVLSFYGSILSLYAADNPLLGEVGAAL